MTNFSLQQERPSRPTEEGALSDRPASEVQQLLSRIIASPSFNRSERLTTFLKYVCEMSLRGHGDQINEQKIGQAVFGRSADYDSTVDGIVRTQASRLRQRLDAYFLAEGADEPLRLEIPRGGYVPLLVARKPEPVVPAPIEVTPRILPPAAAPLLAPAAPGTHRRVWTGIVLLLTLSLAGALLGRHVSGLRAAPAGHPPLWTLLFKPGTRTLVVPGDSGLVLYQTMANHPVDLNEYIRGDYRSYAPTPDTVGQAREIGGRRYTSIVDLQIASKLGQTAMTLGGAAEIRYSRDVRPNDLKTGNAVLIGAAEANPWVTLFERTMNFRLNNDRRTRIFSVVNRSPQGSEPRLWSASLADPQSRVYGVVALVPNIIASGNVLILEGTSMSGTEAAWDFVEDDKQLTPFLDRLRRADGSIPHFEVVLGTNNLGASAVQTTILAWRVDD